MIINNKYTLPYTVSSSAIDAKYRCTPLVFAALAQDLAANHYSSTGLFIPQLQKQGLTWIISKQHFEIYDYPLWMDSLILQTWAQPLRGLFCFRDFAYYYAHNGKKASITAAFAEEAAAGQDPNRCNPYTNLDKHDALCVRGSSCWLVINTETGQPVTPDTRTLGSLSFCDEHLDGRVFARIPAVETWQTEVSFMPSPLDIDMNNHVNNRNYLRWILMYTDPDAYAGKLPSVIDTAFASSALYGEALCCRSTFIQDSVCVHSIIRTKDGSEVFKARTEWADETALSRPFLV